LKIAMVETLATWYLSLAPSFPPSYRRNPKPLERARMEYEDEVAGGFLKWFPRLSLAGNGSDEKTGSDRGPCGERVQFRHA
jgi:hypothetical protein